MGGAAAVALLLSGCASNLPLPISPFQIMSGQWPNKVAGAAAAKNFTIKGDTINYPDLGFTMTRPNAVDWEFIAGPRSVAISMRPEIATTEPIPTFGVSFAELVPGADPKQLLEPELARFTAAKITVTQKEFNLSGIPAVLWDIPFADPATGVRQQLTRIYAFQESRVFIVQIATEPLTTNKLQDQFNAMLTSIVITKPAGQPEATP